MQEAEAGTQPGSLVIFTPSLLVLDNFLGNEEATQIEEVAGSDYTCTDDLEEAEPLQPCWC